MKKYILLSSMFLTALVSCGRTEDLKQESESSSDEQFSIVATFEEPTRTYLNSQKKVVWEAGDQIHAVLPGYSNQYTLTIGSADVGKTTAHFYIDAEKGTYYRFNIPMTAIYPNSAYLSHNSNYFYANIPKVQDYCENSFGRGANLAIAMTEDASKPYVFYNIGGLLKLTVKGTATVSKIELKSSDSGEYLAGNANISHDYGRTEDGTFSWVSELSNKLTLDCGEGVVLSEAGTDFFFYVPCGSLANGFSVIVYDSEGTSMTKTALPNKANAIERSDIKAMPAFTYSAEAGSRFRTKVIPGIYNQCMSSATLETSFLASGLQTGVTKNSTQQIFSVKSWSGEYVYEYRFPVSLTVGNTCSVSIVPVLGNSGVTSSTLNLKFLGSENGLGWFVDENTDKGYIFNVI